MLLRPEQKHVPFLPEVSLGTDSIPVSDHGIFLGVHLDTHLDTQARQVLPCRALLSLYFAFIHSHLTFGIVAWGNAYNSHIPSVQHIQNQAIRIITKSTFYSDAFALLRQNNLLSVQKLFQYNFAILLFKLLNNKLLFHFIDLKYLTNFNPTRFAANSYYLLPCVSTNYGKMSSHFSLLQTGKACRVKLNLYHLYQHLGGILKRFF